MDKIYEMLRDLVGTAKADGNTDEIVDRIMEEVEGLYKVIREYEKETKTYLEYINAFNVELKAVKSKLGTINKQLGR